MALSESLSPGNMKQAHLLLVGLAVLVFFGVAYIYGLDKQKLSPVEMFWMQKDKQNALPIAEESRDYMIPSDVELKNMSNTQWKQIYWKYINRLQTLCKDVVRVGKLKDGGKEICADEHYRPRAPCIIYSFGLNNDFSFDNEAVKMFGCDVFCFDPSMKMESKRISDHVWFYNWGLSGENTVDKQGWKMKTLGTIRNELGHSNVNNIL
ncbi:hypothetical protein DPMN_049625 [Dreissena polymorpha]|uniref:Methyltransferase domain-containing protein n=1 Tax=Dreissena polymorpha TaxID=45954 RepID=A0A9D4CG91_DREPO|nr:hypothetical protein DPMN_049625 [Dreissena polymorpha]